MATEYRLPYSANEINRRLRDVDTKANIMPLSSAEYDALEKVNANTIYMLTDIEDDDVHMVVIIDDADTASHSFSEIKAHVEAGGTAVANYGIEYYPLVLLEEGCARFAAVEDDAHIYGCNIHSDDTVEHISIDLAITVDDTVSKSSTNAIQNKAVYDYVQTAYKAVNNNLIAPITQRLDNASIDELITVEDIDTICGATITYVNLDEGAF